MLLAVVLFLLTVSNTRLYGIPSDMEMSTQERPLRYSPRISPSRTASTSDSRDGALWKSASLSLAQSFDEHSGHFLGTLVPLAFQL